MSVTSRVRSKAAERLLNRELSWLEFNARVLALAADEGVPLLERLKFASIFSSNLDEFFMVRVAGLMGQAALGFGVRSPDGRVPEEALSEIRNRVLELTAEQSRIWNRELRPALDDEGIYIRRVSECDEAERSGERSDPRDDERRHKDSIHRTRPTLCRYPSQLCWNSG